MARRGRGLVHAPILLRAGKPPTELRLSAFQFRADDGTEITASSLGTVSSPLTRLPGALRIRFQVSTIGDTPGTLYRIMYRRNGGMWRYVNVQGS